MKYIFCIFQSQFNLFDNIRQESLARNDSQRTSSDTHTLPDIEVDDFTVFT